MYYQFVAIHHNLLKALKHENVLKWFDKDKLIKEIYLQILCTWFWITVKDDVWKSVLPKVSAHNKIKGGRANTNIVLISYLSTFSELKHLYSFTTIGNQSSVSYSVSVAYFTGCHSLKFQQRVCLHYRTDFTSPYKYFIFIICVVLVCWKITADSCTILFLF